MRRFALLLVLASSVLAHGQDASKDELKKLEGTYVMVSGEDKNEKLTDEQIKTCSMIMAGDKHTVTMGKETFSGTHKINPAKSPKEIDAVHAGSDQPMLGIYKLEGDVFTVCFAPPGKERPKEFTIKSGTGQFIHVWKREKK